MSHADAEAGDVAGILQHAETEKGKQEMVSDNYVNAFRWDSPALLARLREIHLAITTRLAT